MRPIQQYTDRGRRASRTDGTQKNSSFHFIRIHTHASFILCAHTHTAVTYPDYDVEGGDIADALTASLVQNLHCLGQVARALAGSDILELRHQLFFRGGRRLVLKQTRGRGGGGAGG